MHTAHAKSVAHSESAAFAHPERNVSAFGIQPGMKIADFGAGSGVYTLKMAEDLNGSGVVYAIDVQKDLLRRIKNEAERRRLHTVEVIWTDLEAAVPQHASKIADQTLDLVLISNLLFQLAEKEPPLKEAHRILKKGGRLIVIDWSESYGGMGPVREDVVKKEEALEYAEKAGFELMREFPAGAHHYGLILRPKKSFA